MSRTIAVALAAILLALLALLLWRDGTPGSLPIPPAQPQAGAAQPERADAATPAKAGVDADREATARTPAGSEAAPYVVRGVVVADRRRPDLSDVRVLAYRGRADDEGSFMRAAMGAGALGRRPAFLVEGDPIATAPVQADGSFALHADWRHLRITLDHDVYLQPMPEIVHVPEPSRTVELVLSPLLGGMLRGRLLGDDAEAVDEIRLTMDLDPLSVLRDSRALLGSILAAARPVVRPHADHTFTFRAVPTGASLKLKASGGRVGGTLRERPLQPGEVRDVVLPIRGTAAIMAEVVDERGDPVAGARVQVRPAAASGMALAMETRSERTAADGTCEKLTGLEAERHVVEAIATGYVADEQTIDVAVLDEPLRVRLTLGDGGMVTGVVLSPDGEPVADARVAHHPSESIPLLGDLAAQLGPEYIAQVARDGVATDANGRFRLGGISDPDAFLIVGAHEDHVAGVARDVRIGDEQVVVELRPHGSIVGRVVAAETGEAIPDFTVTVLRTSFLIMKTPIAQRTIHDDAGTFHVDKIGLDSYTLEIRADGYAEVEKSIDLEHTEEHDIGTLELERAASISGVVRDEQGAPIANALVRKRRGAMADNPMLMMFTGSGTRTYSDSEGRFTLFPLPAGRIQLLATADGFASGTSERLRVDVGQGLQDVVIVLDHGGSVEGRLVCGVSQRPEDFVVLVQHQITQNTKTADLAPDGSFVVQNLDPGGYQVQAMPREVMVGVGAPSPRPGEGLNFGEMLRKITDNVVSQRCTIRSGEVASVELEVGDVSVGARWRVRVEVGGEPLASGAIEAVSVTDGTLRMAMLVDGEATFPRIKSGQYRMQVRSGLTMTPVGAPTLLDYPEGVQRHESTLTLPGGELIGTVVDDQTDEPLARAVVRLHHDEHSERDDPVGLCLTDRDGRFTFTGLEPGSYSLVAGDPLMSSGRSTASRRSGIRVGAAGETDPVELRSRPAAGASVLVTTAAGRPIVGATVMCVDPDGRPIGGLGIAATGPDGRAWFGGLANGQARIVGRAPGFAPGISTVQSLSTDAATAFDLVLETGAPVRLSVVDEQGRTRRGVTVSARVGDGPWLPAMLLVAGVGADGTIDLGRLAAGRWQLRVTHPSIGTVVHERTIHGTSPVTIVVGT